jgi:uncharacterized protein YkwD
MAANACATPQNINALATEIAAGLNANRSAQGLAQLNYNPVLSKAAMSHACDMSVNGFFGHDGSDGSSVGRRVRAQGYNHCIAAENIAWGYPNASQIVRGWMNSAGHRSIMLHPRVAEFGIGITQGARGPNWVLVLADDCV